MYVQSESTLRQTRAPELRIVAIVGQSPEPAAVRQEPRGPGQRTEQESPHQSAAPFQETDSAMGMDSETVQPHYYARTCAQ